MALSYQEVVSNGSLNTLALSIQFTAQEDISVLYDGAILPYNVTTGRSWVWSNGTTIRFRNDNADAPIPAGVVIRAERNTNVEEIRHVFSVQAGGGGSAKFTNQTMDENFRQFLYTAQESVERTDEAQEAVDQAILVAEGAVTTANAATNTANTALNTANTALDTADAVLDIANQAALDAAAAVSTANSATATANNALGVATGIDAKAQEALDTANDAEDVALGIDAKAQTALDNSNAAVLAASSATSTANDAHDIASGIDAKAQTALDNSNAAVLAAAGATSTANDAKDIAEGVDTKAQSALDTANAAEQTAQDAEDAVAGVYQNASSDHWGPTEPAETFPGMTWADTTSGLFKRRNAADTGWVVEGELFTYKANRNGDITQNFKAAPAAATGDVVTFEQVFGLGQTRQVVTGSRTRLTVYTNTTGKPIWACIQGVPSPANADRFVQINRQGKQAVIGRPRYDGLGTASAETVIFPGETYSYDFSEGSMTNFEIVEYR